MLKNYKKSEIKKQRTRISIGVIFIVFSIFIFTFKSFEKNNPTKKEVITYSFREEVYCTKNDLFFFNYHQKINKNQWALFYQKISIKSKYIGNGVKLNIKWYPSGITENLYLERDQEKIITTHSMGDTGFYLTADNDCIIIVRKAY